MTSWQIAFFTLQVVFGIIVTAFLTMVSALSKDFKSLDKKLSIETGRLREKTHQLEQKQGVSEAVAEERFKSLSSAINEGFKNVEKNIDNINLKIDKITRT